MKKLLLVAGMLCACWPANVWGEVIVGVESASASYSASDQTGWLYVYLHSTESPQPQLKSFDLRFTVNGASGISFVDGQEPPGTGARDYVLPSGAAYTFTQNSPTQITVSDIVLASGDDIVDGRAFVQFEYKIAGGTPIGTVADVNINTSYSDLFTAVGTLESQQLSFAPLNGTIGVVPEPGSLVLLCTGAIAAALWTRYRRSHNRAGLPRQSRRSW